MAAGVSWARRVDRNSPSADVPWVLALMPFMPFMPFSIKRAKAVVHAPDGVRLAGRAQGRSSCP